MPIFLKILTTVEANTTKANEQIKSKIPVGDFEINDFGRVFTAMYAMSDLTNFG